jgi:hypothetical protein
MQSFELSKLMPSGRKFEDARENNTELLLWTSIEHHECRLSVAEQFIKQLTSTESAATSLGSELAPVMPTASARSAVDKSRQMG